MKFQRKNVFLGQMFYFFRLNSTEHEIPKHQNLFFNSETSLPVISDKVNKTTKKGVFS